MDWCVPLSGGRKTPWPASLCVVTLRWMSRSPGAGNVVSGPGTAESVLETIAFVVKIDDWRGERSNGKR